MSHNQAPGHRNQDRVYRVNCDRVCLCVQCGVCTVRGKPTPPSRATAKAEKHRQNPWGSRWTAERSPECASLPLLCRTSTSLGACGWPTGCLVLSSVRGLQMNVCRINGAQHLVERSHECPRRSDQTISMHTRRSDRIWMGLSPSIELNHANGKIVHTPRRIAQNPNG